MPMPFLADREARVATAWPGTKCHVATQRLAVQLVTNGFVRTVADSIAEFGIDAGLGVPGHHRTRRG